MILHLSFSGAGGPTLVWRNDWGGLPFTVSFFAKGAWHTLSAWLSIGWPTLCDFVFCKGWDILRFVLLPRNHLPALITIQPSISTIPCKTLNNLIPACYPCPVFAAVHPRPLFPIFLRSRSSLNLQTRKCASRIPDAFSGPASVPTLFSPTH
jgi:hypothetical protein